MSNTYNTGLIPKHMLYFPKNTTSVSCTELYTHTRTHAPLCPANNNTALIGTHQTAAQKIITEINSLFLAWKREFTELRPIGEAISELSSCCLKRAFCIVLIYALRPRKMETCDARTPSTWGFHDRMLEGERKTERIVLVFFRWLFKVGFLWPPLDLGRRSKNDLSITDPSPHLRLLPRALRTTG